MVLPHFTDTKVSTMPKGRPLKINTLQGWAIDFQNIWFFLNSLTNI